jgi:hypothetical protein
MRLRPLQGSTQHGPPTSQRLPLRKATEAAQSATLMEFLPLRRISSSESTPRRFATPTTFRPQGFAPSRRLSPRSNARPCFMPVTPMGFPPFRGFPSLSGLASSSPVRLPSWRFSSAVHSKLRTALAPGLRKPNQVLASRAFAAFRALLR